MKNNSSNPGLSDFLTQRSHGEDSMPELTKPEPERIEIELENILRWEDDGGQLIAARETGLE